MSTKRVLILGATGMLGHVLLRSLEQRKDIEVFATVRATGKIDRRLKPELLAKVFGNVDANNLGLLDHVFSEVRPNVVINCIGIIKQLPLAQDPITSISINALFPHQLASICCSAGIRLIHFGTDCVFSGKKGNYREDDFSDAEDLYGRTKYLGEVDESDCLTLRTSIIGHELAGKLGLIDWFLSQENRVKGYTNAIYTGFPTVELSRIIAEYVLPNEHLSGVYHVSSSAISKYELLRLVALKYKKKIEIEPYENFICDRSLNSDKFRQQTGYAPPSWKKLVELMYEDYKTNERR